MMRMRQYDNFGLDEIKDLCDLSSKVVCRYPNYVNKNEKIDFSKITDLSSCYSNLINQDFICDCTGVTWLLILNYYFRLKELKPQIMNSLKEHLINSLPDPKFHLYFPRSYEENDIGSIYYLKYLPFYQLMEYFKSNLIPLKTNNMGWWCICVGTLSYLKKVSNYHQTISKLVLDSRDENEPLYLCFWGKREGSDSSISIVTYNRLSGRLVEDAKRDWTNYLESVEDHVKKASQGLFDCNLKINKLKMDSVEFIKLGSLYKPSSNSNLDLANFYENKGLNLMTL